MLVPLVGILIAGSTLVTRDTARIHAPLRGQVVTALRELRLPLWNPHEATGLPLLAQMVHGVLHPVSLVAAAVAPAAGMDPFIVAYALLAAVGAAWLARCVGASAPAAVATGLGYGLSGYVLSMSSVLHYQAAAATAPWAVAALRAAGSGTTGTCVAALAVAILHVAGDPQWALLAALLGAALATEARGLRGLAGAVLAIGLGTALAGVQLATTWAYLPQTVRGAFELPDDERRVWALAPWRLLEFAAPGFFSGRPGASLTAPVFEKLARDPLATGPGVTQYPVPFVPSVFLGAALLALAVAGAVATRLGHVLGVAAGLFLWLAFGWRLGAEQALHALPVWGSFRYAEKMVGPFTLCVALLGGLGVDRFGTHPGRRGVVAVGSAALATTGLLLWLGVGGGEELLRSAGRFAPRARDQLAVGLAHAAAGLYALLALLAAGGRAGAARRHLRVGAAALVAVSSLAALPFALHLGAPAAREAQPLRDLVGTQPVVRVATPLRAIPLDALAHLDATDRMLALDSRLGVAPFPGASGIDQIDTYTALLPLPFVWVDNALGFDRDLRYWEARRRYAITHVVVRRPFGAAEEERARAAVLGGRRLRGEADAAFSIWEVPHRPWAYFAEQVIPVGFETAARAVLARVANAGGPQVVLEGPAPTSLGRGRVLAIERRPERIRVDAESEGDGLLVVNDAYWKGWKAWIDGRPAPILRADALVRAVAWPAGRHTLEMRYEPAEVRVGLWMSATTGLGIALVLARQLQRSGLRQKRRRPGT